LGEQGYPHGIYINVYIYIIYIYISLAETMCVLPTQTIYVFLATQRTCMAYIMMVPACMINSGPPINPYTYAPKTQSPSRTLKVRGIRVTVTGCMLLGAWIDPGLAPGWWIVRGARGASPRHLWGAGAYAVLACTVKCAIQEQLD
jgi:hypothetical protein